MHTIDSIASFHHGNWRALHHRAACWLHHMIFLPSSFYGERCYEMNAPHHTYTHCPPSTHIQHTLTGTAHSNRWDYGVEDQQADERGKEDEGGGTVEETLSPQHSSVSTAHTHTHPIHMHTQHTNTLDTHNTPTHHYTLMHNKHTTSFIPRPLIQRVYRF